MLNPSHRLNCRDFLRIILIGWLFLAWVVPVSGQIKRLPSLKTNPLAGGPAQMHTTKTSAQVWLMVWKAYTIKGAITVNGVVQQEIFEIQDNDWVWGFTPLIFDFQNLEPGQAYPFTLTIDDQKIKTGFKVTTYPDTVPESWSFIMGSCAFQGSGLFNVLQGSNQIFNHMAEEDAAFNLWLGDNSYYFPDEWFNPTKMRKRQIKQRLVREIDALISAMPNYAIWDDHDFGPNDCYFDYSLREESLKIIQEYWANPFYGTPEFPGNYCNFKFRECEFFLLDDRYYREHEDEEGAKMIGNGQMAWFKKKLKASTATFKFVAIGSQVVNDLNRNETWCLYPTELQEVMDFIEAEKISGVVFLTGDRHHTELLVRKEGVPYPFYDFTSSPLTSPANIMPKKSPEFNNPLRVPGTFFNKHNYGRLTIAGEPGNKSLRMETIDKNGKLIWEHTINENELKPKN